MGKGEGGREGGRKGGRKGGKEEKRGKEGRKVYGMEYNVYTCTYMYVHMEKEGGRQH